MGGYVVCRFYLSTELSLPPLLLCLRSRLLLAAAVVLSMGETGQSLTPGRTGSSICRYGHTPHTGVPDIQRYARPRSED